MPAAELRSTKVGETHGVTWRPFHLLTMFLKMKAHDLGQKGPGEGSRKQRSRF